jgi:hypothetical protein
VASDAYLQKSGNFMHLMTKSGISIRIYGPRLPARSMSLSPSIGVVGPGQVKAESRSSRKGALIATA